MKRSAGFLGSLAFAAMLYATAYADDIFKGLRGPTRWQLDERVSYTADSKGDDLIANNLIVKYWDGEKTGKWMFVSLPYKYRSSDGRASSGIGDMTIGGGPRGTIEAGSSSLH